MDKNRHSLEELYIQKGYWRPYSLAQELQLWAEQYGDAIAVVADKQRVTYSQLNIEASKYAAGFRSLGICSGDKVLVQLPNVLEFVLCCFGLFRLGAIPIFTMPASREVDINALCAKAKPVAYISPTMFQGTDYRPIAKTLKESHTFLQHVISLDGEIEGSIPLETLHSSESVEFMDPDFRDTALLLISGGTTGTPKLIPRRHTDYMYVARTCAERCKITSKSVYLTVLPSAHNFPLCCPGILGTLSQGGTVVMCPSPAPDTAFELIEKERVTHTALVPALLNFWLEARKWEKADLSSLELIQVGGSPVGKDVAERVEPELGCKLQQVFGTAEGLICMTHPDDTLETTLNSQGTEICEDDELRFVDVNGDDVPEGMDGELIVRGPYTIYGYYEEPEATATAITSEGFYKTGDIARRLSDGTIRVTGRAKEQINRAGEKIAPTEVEQAIRTIEGIQDVVVVGVEDKELGERICAWVIAELEEFTLQDVRAILLEGGMAPFKLPDQLKHTDSWPLTSVGKINKIVLQSQSVN